MFLARIVAAPAPNEPLLPLAVDKLGFEARGTRLLHDVSLELGAGTRTVVMGPNGAGKSLFLRLCHGLLRPTRGTVRWGLGDAEAARRRQAFVFQRPVLLRRSTLANVTYALAQSGVPWRRRRALGMDALARVGLAHLASRPARLLSGGEQQRVALARAWAMRPELLFLDEATASLDPAATRTIEGIIQAMHEAGVKIVLTTHDLGQARRLADEILFLNKGRLVEHGPAEAFFERPRSEAARAFLAGRLVD